MERNVPQQKKHKALIWYIASRPCLRRSLECLYENFNNHYRYPVVVFSFRHQRYSEDFQKRVHDEIDPTIRFVELEEPQIPSHIKEEELFYHRSEIPYVRQSFPKSRIGYLHTNQFVAGEVMKHPELAGYDYALKMDDDTFITGHIHFDLFVFARDNEIKLAPFRMRSADYARAKETQVGLRELLSEFMKANGVVPKSSAIDKKGNWNGKCPYDPTIWDLRIFQTKEWEKWWSAVNTSGGIYKYRWGDLEIHAMYLAMFYPDSAWHDFGLYEKGVCQHGGYGPVYQQAPFAQLKWKVKKNIRALKMGMFV